LTRARVASAVRLEVRPVMVTGWLMGRALVGWMVTVMVLRTRLRRMDSWITAVVQVLAPRMVPVRVVALHTGVADMAEMVWTARSMPAAGFFRVKVTVEAAEVPIMAVEVSTRVPVVPGAESVASVVQPPVAAKPVPVVVRSVLLGVKLFFRLVMVMVVPDARATEGLRLRVIKLSALGVWLASLMALTNQQPPPAPRTLSVKGLEVDAWGWAEETVGLTPPVVDSVARLASAMVKMLSEAGISMAVVRTRVPVFKVQAPVLPTTAEAAPATWRGAVDALQVKASAVVVWVRPVMVIGVPMGSLMLGLSKMVRVLVAATAVTDSLMAVVNQV